MQSASVKVSQNRLNNRNIQTKRSWNATEWSDNSRKLRKDRGQEYASSNGALHPEIEPPDDEPPCGPRCTKPGCSLSHQRLYELFSQYWESSSYDAQTAILLRLMKKEKCVETRVAEGQSRREATFTYYLLDAEGFELQVCKSTFLKAFTITSRRIQTLQQKLTSGHLAYLDNRGKHPNRPNRLPDNVKVSMGNHIDSYPAHLSHYQREHGDPERLYLSPELSVNEMFDNFVAAYGVEAENWCWAYRQVFKSRNLRFGKPKTDSCSKCDEFKVQIDGTVNDDERLMELWIARVEHHYDAEQAYAEMRHNRELSIENEEIFTINIDLQGVLHSPILTNSEYYYSRKFSTYNLAISDGRTDTATMCLWHCTEGGKGSAEVASCLLRYCLNKFQRLEVGQRRTFICWSDRCSGQNNNQHLVQLLQYFLQIRLFTTVHQKFLTTGHTFLPADRQFALIEKKKKTTKILEPDHWLSVIEVANEVNRNIIQKMNLDDFKNFRNLEAYYRMPPTLRVTQVKWIRMEDCRPNVIFTKQEIHSPTWIEHGVINPMPMANFRFQQLYADYIPIPLPLVKDLRKLLRWIPEENKTAWGFLNEYPNGDEV